MQIRTTLIYMHMCTNVYMCVHMSDMTIDLYIYEYVYIYICTYGYRPLYIYIYICIVYIIVYIYRCVLDGEPSARVTLGVNRFSTEFPARVTLGVNLKEVNTNKHC